MYGAKIVLFELEPAAFSTCSNIDGEVKASALKNASTDPCI